MISHRFARSTRRPCNNNGKICLWVQTQDEQFDTSFGTWTGTWYRYVFRQKRMFETLSGHLRCETTLTNHYIHHFRRLENAIWSTQRSSDSWCFERREIKVSIVRWHCQYRYVNETLNAVVGPSKHFEYETYVTLFQRLGWSRRGSQTTYIAPKR